MHTEHIYNTQQAYITCNPEPTQTQTPDTYTNTRHTIRPARAYSSAGIMCLPHKFQFRLNFVLRDFSWLVCKE